MSYVNAKEVSKWLIQLEIAQILGLALFTTKEVARFASRAD